MYQFVVPGCRGLPFPVQPARRRPKRPRRCANWALKIVLSLGFGLSAQSGTAADFLVSTVTQITNALASAQPGDTITLTNKIWQNADILFKKNGAPDNPITLRAQTPGAVILSGHSRLRIAGKWLVVDGLRFENGYTNTDLIEFRQTSSYLATNCALLNCAIVDYNLPNPTNDNKWVSIYGISNRVENCYFKGKTNLGTTLVVWLPSGQPNLANHHLIRSNYFGPRPPAVANGGETIRVGDSSTSTNFSRTLVEANYFYKCNGEIEIISSKSCENIYRANTFDACEGALTLRHGNACTVVGNWFFGRGLPLTGGVRIIAADHRVFNNYFADLSGTAGRSTLTFSMGLTNSPLNGYFQVSNATVAFNTLVNCKTPLLIGNPADYNGTNATLPPRDCAIGNNIVWGTNAPLVDQRITPVNLTWQGNLMFGAALGIPLPAGITLTNPQLALASDGLWRPATNSPALGAAAGDYPYAADDIDGQARPSAKDIGCDQASDLPATRRPLGPTDIGPAWMRSLGPIRSIGLATNAVTLTWDSLPGLNYKVQYSSNLLAWAAAPQTISTTDTTASWTDDGTQTGGSPLTQPQRFYRILLLP